MWLKCNVIARQNPKQCQSNLSYRLLRRTGGPAPQVQAADRRSVKRGVTLIEMLTVLGLLALLGGMLVSMFGSIDQSYRNVKASLDVYQTARVTLARVNREISATVFDNSGAVTLGLKGSANDISFHTLYSLDSFSSEDKSSDIVALRFAHDPNNKKITRYLKNSDGTNFPPLPVEGVTGSDLAEHVEQLTFEYFESAADLENGISKSVWDSGAGADNKLPSLIRIRLTVKDSKGFIQPKDFESVVYLKNAI